MAGIYQNPKADIFDVNGVPFPGAKLYFYITGTSTPTTVYASEALTTTLTNPVVADANGRFAPIYLEESIIYKIVLTTSAGASIYSVDPWYALPITPGDLGERVLQIASTPLDYGGVGDGSTNDAAAVQAAITNASGTVDLLGKTYRVDSSLTIPSNRRIVNGKLDFSSATDLHLLAMDGSVGSLTLLTAAADPGDITLTMGSTTGLAAGDYLHLQSTGFWYSSTVTEGEIVRILTVDSGTQLTLSSRVMGSYALADAANIRKMTLVENVTIRDVEIVAASVSIQQIGIWGQYTRAISVENCRVSKTYDNAIRFAYSADCHVSGTKIKDIRSTGQGVGIKIVNSSSAMTISDCTIDNAIYGIQVGGRAQSTGITRNVSVVNCNVNGATINALHAALGSEHITWSNCTVDGNTAATGNGFVGEGSAYVVSNCTFRNIRGVGAYLTSKRSAAITTDAGGYPVSSTTQNAFIFSSNILQNSGNAGIQFFGDSASAAIYGAVIASNVVQGCGEIGIFAQTNGANLHNITICNNGVNDCGDAAIKVRAVTQTAQGVTIQGNRIHNYGIDTPLVPGIYLLSDSGASLVYGVTCTDNNIGASSSETTGIRAENVGRTIISNNTIDCTRAVEAVYAVAGTYDGIAVTRNRVNIADDYAALFQADTGAVVLSATCDDNMWECNGTADGVTVTQTGTGRFVSLTFDGNTIDGPSAAGFTCTHTGGSAIGMHSWSMSRNKIKSAPNYAIAFSPGANVTYDNVSIDENSIAAMGTQGLSVQISSSAIVRGLSIDRNKLVKNSGSSTYPIDVNHAGTGTVRNVSIDGNKLQLTGASGADGIRIRHGSSGTFEHISVSKNDVRDATDSGIAFYNLGTAGMALVNCDGNHVNSCPTGIYWDAQSSGVNQQISMTGNSVANCTDGILFYNETSIGFENISLHGNTFRSVGGTGIACNVSGTGYYKEMSICGNSVEGPTNDGISVVSGSSSATHLTILGNVINNPGDDGIAVENFDKVVVASNTVESAGDDAIIYFNSLATELHSVTVANNALHSPGGDCVKIIANVNNGGISYVNVEGNTLRGGDVGIRLDSSSGTGNFMQYINVSGNTAKAQANHCLIASTTGTGSAGIRDLHIASNNFVRDDDTDPNIELTGSGNYTGGAAIGNYLRNGSYGITKTGAGAIATFRVLANHISGMGTAALNGLTTEGAVSATLADAPSLTT